MDHVGCVGYRHGIQHITHQRNSFQRRDGAALFDNLVQRASSDIFKDQVGLMVLDVSLVHRDNIRMFDPPHATGLVQPLHEGLGVRPSPLAHDLDGHFALHPGVKRQPHRGLCALPQNLAELKPTQGVGYTQCAGCEW